MKTYKEFVEYVYNEFQCDGEDDCVHCKAKTLLEKEVATTECGCCSDILEIESCSCDNGGCKWCDEEKK